MEIYYATQNSAKVHSLQRDLSRHGISVIQAPLDIPEPRSSDVQEITEQKIGFAYAQIKKPVVVLDAGFYIHALNGFPRAFVNFALETVGLEGILKLVENKSRDCEFRECLAYLDDSLTEPQYFLANIRGHLSHKPRGQMQTHLWSELGLIFIPEGTQQTLAEMTLNQYLQWRKNNAREKESSARLFSDWLVAYRK